MRWKYINTGENTGFYNMDYDIKLVENCKFDEAHFRIYRWKPYCISLGYTQNSEEVNQNKAKEDNIDIVRRPTGGRAILHAEEITYSVVLPLQNGLTARMVYAKISEALIKGLIKYNPIFVDAELENIQPNFAKVHQQPSGMVCFASTAKSEVKFKGKKIIGSAQRKMGNYLLQHGSILCGTFHRKLIDYLNNLTDYDYKLIKNEFYSKTIEIETIIENRVDYDKLTDCLVKGFKEEWGIEFDNM
jgi:lipoate-protein ligase A